MTLAAIGLLAATALLFDLLKLELRGRLDRLPLGLLRLARLLLPRELRESRCDGEWVPELERILGRAKGLPVTRLIRGCRFSLGSLAGAMAVGRQLRQAEAATAQGVPIELARPAGHQRWLASRAQGLVALGLVGLGLVAGIVLTAGWITFSQWRERDSTRCRTHDSQVAAQANTPSRGPACGRTSLSWSRAVSDSLREDPQV